MRFSALVFIFLSLLFACNTKKNEISRPHDPWVFRSVLDGNPRMLTAALHKKLWVSYSTEKCGIYKAWQGDVNFDGSVYNGAHGPQPEARGNVYFTTSLNESPWLLVKNGQEVKTKIQYKGHAFKDSQLTLKYALEYEKGKAVLIEETPEFSESGKKQPSLKRIFQVQNLPQGYELKLKLKLEKDYADNQILTSSKFTPLETNKNDSTQVFDGLLTLKPNDKTEFSFTFTENFAEQKQELAKKEKGMETMFENRGCYSCHNPQKKTVGPAYVEIAQKYKKTAKDVNYLVNKILKGGAGVWGKAAMSPHPDLPQEDAQKMVEYILAMNPENNKPESKNAAANVGLQFNIYQIWEDWKTLQDLPKEAVLYRSYGHNDMGGWLEVKDVLPVESNFLVVAKGILSVKERGNTLLKLYARNGGGMVKVDNKVAIESSSIQNSPFEKEGEITLEPGDHQIEVRYYCAQLPDYNNVTSSIMGLGVYNSETKQFESWWGQSQLVRFNPQDISKEVKEPTATYAGQKIPGDGLPLESVHPAFELSQARPDTFQPRVAGLDFFEDGRMVITTWDSTGAVYVLDNLKQTDHNKITYKKIAFGLAEPLGLKVIGKDIYVLQKQELTRLVDTNGDEVIDEYQTLCNSWTVNSNFHQFAFGLAFKENHFYFALAIAIEPGGKSSNPQNSDRGKVVKVNKDTGELEFIAQGLRTPNGIGFGVDNELFIADNQGDWLPASKIVHVKKGAFYGSRAVDFKGTEGLKENLPVVWLPQDEIGNSPSQPIAINVGPYKGQMLHGEVTHGGIKRVFAEKVNGEYQGVVFRFTQGMEAGVNRLAWSPDGQLYAGEIGVSGNWGHVTAKGMGKFGLQRLKYNGKSIFEMLAVRAKTNGLEIEFTEALEAGEGWNPDHYLVKQWWYKPTENYGGPKLDEEKLKVKSANVSADRKKVFLEIEGIKENHVVYLRLKPFISSLSHDLWSTEAWYTMNQIPKENLGAVSDKKYSPAPENQLNEEEAKAGWKLLFDGKTTANWHNFNSDKIGQAWKVADNALMFDNSQKDKDGRVVGGGDIVSNEEFENFELKIDWKISVGGNSGIFFNVVEDKKFETVWRTGPEMQVLDDAKHPDARFPKHHAGDLYDLIACKFVTVKPAGEWNQARLVVKNGKVEHWLNGYKVVEYQMFNEDWKKLIAGSKFKDMPDFGKAKKGRLALQDHGDKVWFKNIKIRKL
jgi:cytochrome c